MNNRPITLPDRNSLPILTKPELKAGAGLTVLVSLGKISSTGLRPGILVHNQAGDKVWVLRSVAPLSGQAVLTLSPSGPETDPKDTPSGALYL